MIVSGFFLAAAGCWGFAPEAAQGAAIEKDVLPGIAAVYAYQSELDLNRNVRASQGSGFFIDNGEVLTNYHFLDKKQYFRIRTFQNKEYNAELAAWDRDLDIALLHLGAPRDEYIYLSIHNRQVKQGALVFAAGVSEEKPPAVSGGTFLNLRRLGDEIYLQIAGTVPSDFTGGPVLNRQGRVVGLTTTLWEEEGFAFAVPSSSVLAFLKTLSREGYVPAREHDPDVKESYITEDFVTLYEIGSRGAGGKVGRGIRLGQ
jgi:S1-C subfamily serine protease